MTTPNPESAANAVTSDVADASPSSPASRSSVSVRGVQLGAGRPAVIIPLTAATLDELTDQVRALAGQQFDLVEWRMDLYDASTAATATTDTTAVVAASRALRDLLGDTPLLATFRTAAEGGARALDAADYADLLTAVLAAGSVDAVDIELAVEEAQGRRVQEAAAAHGVVTVLSAHDFDGTPPAKEIVARLRAMEARGADIVKMAVMPHDAEDVLALLAATTEYRTTPDARPAITMAMGGLGVITRLAGEVFGSAATFAAVGSASAPGQVPAAELAPVLDLLHGALTENLESEDGELGG